jgi:hypothetical protein
LTAIAAASAATERKTSFTDERVALAALQGDAFDLSADRRQFWSPDYRAAFRGAALAD